MDTAKRMVLNHLWQAAGMPTAMILPLKIDEDWLFHWLLKDLSTILYYGEKNENAKVIKQMIIHQLDYLVKHE